MALQRSERSLSGAAGAYARWLAQSQAVPPRGQELAWCVSEWVWKVWLAPSPAEHEVATVGKSDVSKTLSMFSLGKLALARLHRLGPSPGGSRRPAFMLSGALNRCY